MREKNTTVVFCIVISLFAYLSIFAIRPQAAVYYISSSSGSDFNPPLLQSKPWKTLEKLNSSWNRIMPGDSILLKRGDVFAPSSISRLGVLEIPNHTFGKENNVIYIGAYGSGNKPIISNENVSTYSRAVYTRATAYITIQDLKIRGGILFRADEDSAGTHHIKLVGIELDGLGISFFNEYQPANTPAPNLANPCHHIEIGNCMFTNTEGQDAVNISATQGYNYLHHNRFYNITEEAIDMGGGCGSVVEYNYVSGVTGNGIKLHSQFSKQSCTVVRGNHIITGNGNFNYALALENISESDIYNNTLVGYYSAFIGWLHANPPLISENDGKYDLRNNRFLNNIFGGVVVIGQAKGVIYNYRNGQRTLINQDDIWDDNYFSNNLYYSDDDSKKIRIFNFKGTISFNSSVEPYGRYSGDLAVDEINVTQNKFGAMWGEKKNVKEDIYNDPLFVNPHWNNAFEAGDYHLSEDSKASASGVLIPEYKFDIENNAIPESEKPDKGAYQRKGRTSGLNNKSLCSDSDKFCSLNAYPNPFNSQAVIRFSLPVQERAEIVLFNIGGQAIRTITDMQYGQGVHEILFDASGLSSGLYFCVLLAGGQKSIAKLLLVK